MRILVCGGRDYDNDELVDYNLDGLKHDGMVIIQGGARGADKLAKAWAYYNKVTCEEYKADWKTHGNAAGPIRNRLMIDDGKPDLVIAFPGGKGTANMVSLAQKAGIKTVIIN